MPVAVRFGAATYGFCMLDAKPAGPDHVYRVPGVTSVENNLSVSRWPEHCGVLLLAVGIAGVESITTGSHVLLSMQPCHEVITL